MSLAGASTGGLRTPEPVSVRAVLRPSVLVSGLWRHRDLIRQFTSREVREAHRATALGMVWTVAYPLLRLAVYVFVFGLVLEGRLTGNPEEARTTFALYLFCGLIVYGLFGEPVVQSPGMVVSRPNYVKKVVFPLEILPVSAVGAQLVTAGVSLVVLYTAALLLGHGIPWTAVLLPLMLLPQVLLTVGLCWLLASLGVFLRDLRQAVAIIAGQLLFFMTPIFYRVESVPEPFRAVVMLNPQTPIVTNARAVALEGVLPDWWMWAGSMVAGLAAAQLGYAFFMKSKRGFADVL